MTTFPIFDPTDQSSPLLRRLLERTPHNELYHYTSVSGLRDILMSRTVWATKAQYMSDAQEFHYALSIARTELAKREYLEADQGRKAVMRHLRDAIQGMEGVNICVFSLSEEGDLLSQWRGYCPPNVGYAIGFSGPGLSAVLESQNCVLAPCEYIEVNQRALVDEALMPIWGKLPTVDPSNLDLIKQRTEPLLPELFARLMKVAALIKHPKFAEEKEWRLVSPIVGSDHPRMGHRVGTTMLLPHFVVDLERPDVPLPLGKIVIGPTLDQSLASQSLVNFLTRYKLPWKEIQRSRVPYRTM